MGMKRLAARAATVAAATAIVGGLVAGAVATPASASTIQRGWIQFCVQGNYTAFIHVLSELDPKTGRDTTTVQTSPMRPGQVINGGPPGCTWFPWDTDGVSVQVDVVRVAPDGSQHWINDTWYNSNSGLGIGAEGTQTNPYITTW
jgi:hypothetical protein